MNSPLNRQLFAASPTILIAMSVGMLFGNSATLIPELLQPESDIEITIEISSWIASVVPLLTACGCLLGAPLMDYYGRKKTIFIYSVPHLLGWIAVAFAPNLVTLLIGRILGGISTGVHTALFPAFISEISEPKFRGGMLTLPSLAAALGILVVHVVGTYFTWRTTALVAAAIPLVTIILLFFVPESPSWYILKDRLDDAQRAFFWLRGNGEAAKKEFTATWEQHKQNEASANSNQSTWLKLTKALSAPKFSKPFTIVSCSFFMLQFTGPYFVIFYSVSILQKVLNSTVDEYLVMNIIDFLRLGMVIIAVGLLRISPRRTLMFVSSIGTTLAAFGLAGLSFILKFSPTFEMNSWIPIALFVSYIVFVSIGIFVLPFCLAGELFSLEYRSIGTSLNMSINYFLFFVVVKIGPAAMDTFGMAEVFLSFGAVGILGTVILCYTMPETKNRTLAEIEQHFSTKKILSQ